MSKYQIIYQHYTGPETYQLTYDDVSGTILIGTEYNLSTHSADEIVTDLVKAGFDRYTATNLSEGASKTGTEAQIWIQEHRFLIISDKQHQDLFEYVVIPELEAKATHQLSELHTQYPSYFTKDFDQLSEIQQELILELTTNGHLAAHPQLTYAIIIEDWDTTVNQLQSLNLDISNRVLTSYFNLNLESTSHLNEWNLNEYENNNFENTDELKIPTNYDFTFNQEIGHQGQSLIPHFPGGKSGVTIGSGYDMGHRTPDEIYRDLTAAGIDPQTVEVLMGAASKIGSEAQNWVSQFGNIHITEEQQRYLFYGILVPEYEERTQEQLDNFLKKHPEIDPSLAEWDNLSDKQRQMLFDFTYNAGLDKFPTFVKAVLYEDWENVSHSFERYSAGELLEFRNESFYNEFLEESLNHGYQSLNSIDELNNLNDTDYNSSI